jgi:hypothetical protein
MIGTDPAVKATTAAKAQPATSEDSHSLQMRVPEKHTWEILVRDLKLSSEQANALWITIRHVAADLEDYITSKAKAPPRATLVENLKLMEKAFRNVRSEIDRSVHLMNDFLSPDLLMYVGRSLTYHTMSEALGEDVFPKDPITRIVREIRNRRPTIADLEDYYVNNRHTLGLKKGHLLLKHLIERVHDSLRDFVEADRLNDGGRPPNVVRRVLIYRLAEVAPEIIGKPAPIGKTGPFVRLCSEVLPACGLSAEGIEAAIPSIVREIRARDRGVL